jgi:hypothetical protein
MDTNARLDHLEHSVGSLTTEVALLRANTVSPADLERALRPIHTELAVIKLNYVTKGELAKLESELGKMESKMFRWFLTFGLAQVSLTAAMIRYL